MTLEKMRKTNLDKREKLRVQKKAAKTDEVTALQTFDDQRVHNSKS